MDMSCVDISCFESARETLADDVDAAAVEACDNACDVAVEVELVAALDWDWD